MKIIMSLICKILKSLQKVNPLLNCTRQLSLRTGITSPHSVPPVFHFTNNSWIWRKPEPIKLPLYDIPPPIIPGDLIKLPSIIEPDDNKDLIIEDPVNINNNNKEAVRLLIIRRKKMKKHKLRKVRKKLKYFRAKLRQRKKQRKEKEFQAALIAQYKKAEAFSAEEYVAERLKLFTAKPPVPFSQTEEYKELMRRKDLRLDVNKFPNT